MMLNGLHLGSELKRFSRGKLPPLALTVIIMLPLLFGGLFVWSYWDPIDRINKMPIALVNSDEGASVDGQQIKAASQIVDKLRESDQVHLEQVSSQDALSGVNDGKYYFAIEFPTDFSVAAVSANSDTPHKAKLNVVFNTNNGFMAMTLGNQVVVRIIDTINEELGAEVASKLLVGFNTIGEGLHQAGDGASQLAEGTGTAEDGATKLADGASQLNDGLTSAQDGVGQLAEGAQKLDAGINSAANGADQLASGMTRLQSATDELGAGAGQVADGVDQLTGFASGIEQTQQQLLAPLVNLSASLRATGLPQAMAAADQADQIIAGLQNPNGNNVSELISKLDQLNAGAKTIHNQLADPAAAYRSGVDSATAASGQLATGLHTLADGSQQLVIGTQTLADGTSKLVEGSNQLTVGANSLATGLVKLDDGSNELALKLNESATQIPNFPEDTLDDAARNVSSPAALNYTSSSSQLFGEGLAPIFISLGLFMGGTVCFMLLRPLQRRAVDAGANPLRVVMASYIPAMLVGLAQATVMFGIQRLFIGVHAVSELGMWAAMCLTSMAFMAITQGLNVVFGSTVGRVLCIALMSLQIVSSGGIYPPETQPLPLKWFHTYDPMTYSVNLIRQAMFGMSPGDDRAIQAIVVLVCIALGMLLASSLAARRERQIRMKEFHPEVAV
ncbi:ABC-2 family transporter protein [Corynebacterium atrinae]|uniref:YhgE/Pip domain-containing protein n=1 Tax=Corynebacterium atrinae TaxID=1336740 RepID=UPI0025B3C79D|nr:YhgE/Pip domain-containing protein [Corynebacterium atrinae]WJY63609.1 ABC-2 family transporter protein [Corynebacterium atrinae]